MSIPRRIRNAGRHLRVLSRSVACADGRRQLGEMITLLRQAARAYRAGGLPALSGALDAPGLRPLPPGAPEGGLANADALAALARARPFRYCLRRSVLRYLVLRAAGYAPVFVIGAERTPELDGHAWIELERQPFREEDDRPRRMTVTYRHKAPAAPTPVPREELSGKERMRTIDEN